MTHQFSLRSSNLKILPRSLAFNVDVEYWLARTEAGTRLVILAPVESASSLAFDGQHSELAGKTIILCPLSPANANTLRSQLTWLQPQTIGLKTSAGLGDRLGIATPGHVRAIRNTAGSIAPVFTQQSIREMTRTCRTPQQVMDDAIWGVFEEGWQSGFGADADHLKTFADIDACLPIGYTFFTIDPGDHVNNRAETAGLEVLRALAEKLPPDIQPRASGLQGKTFQMEGYTLTLDEHTLLKATVKYGGAVAHVLAMYQYLSKTAGSRPFEFEVSVDETDQPTSHAEHIYIAHELKRLGVQWVSLAPRYVGRFEKGVDYIGDVDAFEADIAGHAAIARSFGPYKLSLHSGSDKFSIYPAAMRQTRGLVHLKTAGTSYLEALRTIASIDVDFFGEIYKFARERFDQDKASYHISAKTERAPLPNEVTDWLSLFDQFDAREILHVTFGSVLTYKGTNGDRYFYDRIMQILQASPEAYAINLEKHFGRHLEHFMRAK